MGGSHSRGRIHESKGNIRRTGKADRARGVEGEGTANVSLWLCAYIMTTPGQISKKPIGPVRRLLEIYYPRLLRSARVIKRCFRPRRSVLRPFRRGAPRQRPANPMENRREKGREAPAEEPFPVEIYAAGNSVIKQRYAIYLSR